jgi:polyisoprenoid-binding protein YceI/predicted dinucleotide-binding enzyme
LVDATTNFVDIWGVDMKYAIIGSGNIGSALAERFADHGVEAVIANTRGPGSIDTSRLGSAVTPVTLNEALTAEMIIVAIPFLAVRELGFSRPDWSGKIVVDTTNAFLLPNADEVLNGRLSTELNAEAFPGAAVVKSFNQTAVKQFTEKRPPEFGKRAVFVASNSPAASAAVTDLADKLGFAPIQLGRIDEGGVLIQARNALTLRNLYEMPLNPEGTTTMTAGIDSRLNPGTWVIDPVHSSITFSVGHLMVSKVRGRFSEFSGSITVPDNGIPVISATVAVGSVDTGNKDRDHHLRAPDFFDVENFPTATFTSTGLREDSDRYALDGEFSLRGVTKPITLTLEFFGVSPGMGKGEVAGFEARVAVSRKDFGVLTDTPIIGGGALLGDTVDITIEAEALKAV